MNSTHNMAEYLRTRRNPAHLAVGLINVDALADKGQEFLSDAKDQAIKEGKQKASELVHEHAGSTAGRIFDAGLGVETPAQQAPIDFSALSRISPLWPVTQSILAQNQQRGLLDAVRRSPTLFDVTRRLSPDDANRSILDETQRQTSEQKSEDEKSGEKKPMNKGLIIGGVIAGALLIGGGVYFATRDT
jgi:hypothetical protein